MKKRALLSVSNKDGIVEFAKGLQLLGFEIISTGGTAKELQKNGIKIIPISDITSFPECLDGRVKTLHPAVHAGLLALRNDDGHMAQLKELGIDTIDVVAVNLYPFKETIVKPGVSFSDAVENIDIGGPTMLRSAAKNYQGVLSVVDPSDYGSVLERLSQGNADESFRLMLMYKVFQHTAVYDSLISAYLREKTGQDYTDEITLAYAKTGDLRYGENPHQKAGCYSEMIPPCGAFGECKKLHGKELSFNNINDTNGAIELLREFSEPAVVAVKHSVPCGVALGKDIFSAYVKAHDCDPVSIFGGIIALNREVDAATAAEINKIFIEVVVAPSFSSDALAILTQKPNIRLLEHKNIMQRRSEKEKDVRGIFGGVLIQDKDISLFDKSELKCVTKSVPDGDGLAQLEFAYKVVKHAKSNAIVISSDFAAVGIAGGQTNRIWAARQAIEHAGVRAKGAVAASDAYFPFGDCAEALISAGITAIIQPGGSIRDAESIDICNARNVSMVFTGERHFRH